MIRFAEAALQVRGGMAEQRQVDGAKRALGHAYGGHSQFFAMWIVGDELGLRRLSVYFKPLTSSMIKSFIVS